MNLSIGTFPTTWKRIKTQHLVALCGAALALSAAVGVGAWQATSSGGSASGPAVTVGVQRPAPVTTFYYVVDSLLRAQAIVTSEAELFMAVSTGGTLPDTRAEVIDTSTPAGEAAFAELQRSVMAYGANVNIQVVEMRGR